MRIKWKALSALLFVGVAMAQTPEEQLRSKIADVHYPPLAEMARIQGDVHMKLTSGSVSTRSGPPLITPIATENAKTFGSIPGTADLDITYHFVMEEHTIIVPTPVTVKKGNAFGRAMLRLFGLKTEKTVIEQQCQRIPPPPNNLRLSGTTLEIWIHGSVHCLETQAD